MFDSILQFLQDSGQQYGYLIVGLASFLENSVGLGIVIPGDTILILAGLLAQQGSIQLEILIPLAFVAAVIGDNVGYAIGRYGGQQLLRKLEKRNQTMNKRLTGAEEYFKKHGGKTVVTGRFVAFIRSFVPFIAGVGKMPYWKFFIYNLVGAALQVTALILLGFFFGTQLPLLEKIVSRVGVALLVIILVGGFLLYRRHKRRSE